MNSRQIIVLSFLVGGLIMMLIMIALTVPKSKYEKDAISHQCAEYNSQTGKFQWLNEVK